MKIYIRIIILFRIIFITNSSFGQEYSVKNHGFLTQLEKVQQQQSVYQVNKILIFTFGSTLLLFLQMVYV